MIQGPSEGVTRRAFVIGTAVSLFVGLGVILGDNIVRGSGMARDFASPIALFILFVLVAVLNPVMGWLRRPWHLSTAEVTLVYIMALAAATIPSMGLTSFFIPYLTGAHYYATPENRWADVFMPHVPDWLVPQDPRAIQDFYEGNPQGAIAWDAWLPSLMAWAPFLLALYMVMIAAMVILRQQWMQHERLQYPLMQPSLALIAQEKGRLLPPLFRYFSFWIGVSIPFTVGCFIALHDYDPSVPDIPLDTALPFFPRTTYVLPSLSFATVGFTYFLSRDISLGIWLINLIAKMQEGTLE